MALYTFLFEFRGGLYINQVQALNEIEARINWAMNLDCKKIKYCGDKIKNELLIELESEELTEIEGTINVWIFNISLKGHFSTVHVIKTDNE